MEIPWNPHLSTIQPANFMVDDFETSVDSSLVSLRFFGVTQEIIALCTVWFLLLFLFKQKKKMGCISCYSAENIIEYRPTLDFIPISCSLFRSGAIGLARLHLKGSTNQRGGTCHALEAPCVEFASHFRHIDHLRSHLGLGCAKNRKWRVRYDN